MTKTSTNLRPLMDLQQSIAALSAEFESAIDRTLSGQTAFAQQIRDNSKVKLEHFEKMQMTKKTEINETLQLKLQQIKATAKQATEFEQARAEVAIEQCDDLFDALKEAELEAIRLVDGFENQVNHNGASISTKLKGGNGELGNRELAPEELPQEEGEEIEFDERGNIITREDVDGDGKPD